MINIARNVSHRFFDDMTDRLGGQESKHLKCPFSFRTIVGYPIYFVDNVRNKQSREFQPSKKREQCT